ncbi:type IX secretion system sortase PorU [Flavobacterium salilacus subsp. salilacus]|uniref:type IX secretion system sortase PorU n=1 Tax=Flavobacterium TaxID=237 RepID=UPI00107585F4|nr:MULTISPECIES: type IX secretion system sortase PorU [Flavobacterium]KAF2519624.1 type IX secretion system sortase PorU [Flavobacterium salilacus subsp. salilacus]MBE1614474.1 type IX secretion system sortase PorU [Flavobacterium sp. SaA2.13]
MKYQLPLYILLYSLFSLTSFGQQSGVFTLEWKDNVPSFIGDVAVTLPEFQSEYMYYDADNRQLFFSNNIPVTAAVNPNSLRITNVVYESITPSQLGDISDAKIGNAPNAAVSAIKSRDDWYAKLKLSPIIKEGSGYKRIKSFSYSFTFNAQQRTVKSTNSFTSISNSVLASGAWYRFYVEKSGVYKVTRSFLQQLGFDVNTDPRNIKIYGNGGRMLPLLNEVDYPADLAENAIQFIGEEDGSFDNSDYILFYAEGVDNWNADSRTHSNLFADRSYYYVTSAGGTGKRISTMPEPVGAPDVTTTSFDEYLYHEKDLVSIARLGRKWHGEQFNVENEQEFEFEIPNVVATDATIIVSAAAASINSTSMSVNVNGQDVGSLTFQSQGQYDSGFDGYLSSTFTPSSNVTVSLNYNNGGVPTSNAWLDYIIIKAKRNLTGNNKQFRFEYNDAANNIGVIQYQFTNASGINAVWDITDLYNATKVADNNASQFSFKATMGEVRKYITVVPSDYYTPLRESNARVANQNLKGTIFNNAQGQFQDIDYLIVTPEFLLSQAESLANIHRSQSGLNVKVVTLDKIYQEFSSGKQDIGAIRNFVKYIYNNASSDQNKIKYVNLFGDASFDFKDRIPNNTNIVPIYHDFDPNNTGRGNYSIVTTYVSDDFFVMMDDGEGAGSGAADIAVGRIVVSTTTQAEEMVNKVAEYLSEEAYGRWRNEYLIIADDADAASDVSFVPEQEELVATIIANRPFINMRKVYIDSYVQQASSGGERYPDAKEQIIRSINFGTLVVNYLGHGSENGIASERLLEAQDAIAFTNRFKYTLFITATCDLTRFDNPYRTTAGEEIYWNPTGGAIAMMTTTRAIFISAAISFNTTLASKLYAFDGGQYPSMAEALRQAKSNQETYRLIAFVGDPALKLAVAEPNIVLTKINDIPVADVTEPIKSLENVTLAGNVTTESGSLLANYNGELEITVFDKNIQRETLNNDGNLPENTQFNTLGETIFRGSATVRNGQFDVSFVVPRDIRIPVDSGRVSFYAKRNGVFQDQTGYDNDIQIGGINPNATEDRTAPVVRLYMNDESFVSGGITNSSPILLAFLQDEHGINTASGIGHDIIGILDGDETNPFLMNDYYEASLDDYTRGQVRFPFSDLEKGLHTLTFKAWDVYNNLVIADIQFVVAGDDALELERVLNYPNPFVSYTEFWFNHNRPFEPLDVQVQVFTVTGKVVRTINQTVITDGFLCREITWDGRDDFGDKIGKGVYIYKLTVKSSTTNKTAHKYEKLVLL